MPQHELHPFSDTAKNLKLGVYKHYKGNEYRVLHIARLSGGDDSLEEMVVYEALYDDHPIFVKPLREFVDHAQFEGIAMPRFVFIRPDEK